MDCDLCDILEEIRKDRLYNVYDYKSYVKKECSACNSTGKVNVYLCDTCSGQGSIVLSNALKETEIRQCPNCNSKGYNTGPLYIELEDL